jgi:hypothetical protein
MQPCRQRRPKGGLPVRGVVRFRRNFSIEIALDQKHLLPQ